MNTGTPRRRAKPWSTWSVPMQKQPIATSFFASARTSAVSWVLERIPITCAGRTAATSSSPVSARGWVSTFP